MSFLDDKTKAVTEILFLFPFTTQSKSGKNNNIFNFKLAAYQYNIL